MKNNAKNRKKQGTQFTDLKGTRWSLTIHGASLEDCPILALLKKEFQKDEYILAAVAYETGKYGIHPHWQTYFETAKQCRMKKIFQQLLGDEISFHIELCKATRNANLKYIYAVDKEHQIGWIHYAKGHNVPSSYCSYKTQNLLWLRDNMKPWQKEITVKLTSTQPSYRDILWVWEPAGNTGKTYLAKYLHYFHGAIITGGKSEDMKHAIARWNEITGHYPVAIIIDLARSDKIFNSGYKAIEQIKNALFFSGKYESGMVASCNPPHLVVFANVAPNFAAMSKDRWVVKAIDPQTETLVDAGL